MENDPRPNITYTPAQARFTIAASLLHIHSHGFL
jgi:hypothetical protein